MLWLDTLDALLGLQHVGVPMKTTCRIPRVSLRSAGRRLFWALRRICGGSALCLRWLALFPLSRYHQYIAPSAQPYMGNNKTKSKASSNGNRPRKGGVYAVKNTTNGIAIKPRPTGRSVAQSRQLLRRTAHLRDPRLPPRAPNFTVTQRIEKDRQGSEHVRYEVTGDLDAPVPPIRDSKYLNKEQASRSTARCCSTAEWRGPRKSLQAGQSSRRSLFRTRPGGCSCASAYALDKDDGLRP